jgi:hypothetical protein
MGRKTNEQIDAERMEELSLEEARDTVFDQWRRSEDRLVMQRRPKWQAYYELYRSYEEKDANDSDGLRSELFIPMIFSHVESFLPRLVANRPRVEVWGRGPEDITRAKQQRLLIMWQWEFMGMPLKLVEFVKNALIYGTAIWRVGHERIEREKTVRVAKPETETVVGQLGPQEVETGKIVIEEEKRLVTEWDGPQVGLWDLDNVFPDPEAPSFYEGGLIFKSKKTLGELEDAKDINGDPYYEESVLTKLHSLSDKANQAEVQPGNSQAGAQKKLLEQMREDFGGEGLFNSDPHKREVHILERFDKDWETVCVMEFEDELDPLRHKPNPLGEIPVVAFTPIPLPNEPYGISLPEILYSLNDEINTLHSARKDNIMMSVHRMVTIRRGSGVNPRHLQMRPSGKIMVDEHDDIQAFQTPGIDFAPYREADEVRMWSQLASGATDTFQGLNSGFTGGTATEATLLEQASASRAGLMFQVLTEQALKRLAKLLIKINELSITEDTYVRVAGAAATEPLEKISPEDLLSGSGVDLDAKIDVAATEPGTRQFKQQQSINAIQVFAQFLPPEHPVLERLIIQLGQGFDIEDMEALLQQGRQAIADEQARENPPLEAASQSETQGDVLAELLGGGEI